MKRYEELYDVLNKELQPALGCTEPAAVTYACAVAAKALGVPAEKVEIAASKNILKNVYGGGDSQYGQLWNHCRGGYGRTAYRY